MVPRTRALVFSAVPHVDEGLFGYLIRLTEINQYATPSWILQLASLGQHLRKVWLAFEDSLELAPLAHLTGIEEVHLLDLSYRPLTRTRHNFSDRLVGDSSAPRIAIRPDKPKVCPICLKERGFVRKVWDLTAVTTCPFHRILLLDRCPKCNRRLPLTRNRVSFCHCDFDWRLSPVVRVPDRELEITRRIHSLCGLSTEIKEIAKPNSLGPLNTLGLKDLLLVLFSIGGQFREPKVTAMAKATKSASNAEIHFLLQKAIGVFQDWPGSYFSFLDWQRQNSNHRDKLPGINKDFGQHKGSVYNQLTAPAFDFLREAFEEYICQRWDGGHLSMLRRISRSTERSQRFMSKQEARKALGVNERKIDEFLKEGTLRGIIRHKQNRRMRLIETKSVEVLKNARAALLNKNEAMKRLALSPKQFEVIVRGKFLHKRKEGNDRRCRGYSLQEVESLLTMVARLANQSQDEAAETIAFGKAQLSVGSMGIGLAGFIQAVIAGKIRPCQANVKLGFKGLTFYRRDLDEFVNEIHRKAITHGFRLGEAANKLDCSVSVVSFLIDKQLLVAHKRVIGGRSFLTIPKKAVAAFTKTYVLGKHLLTSVRTSRRFLMDTLKSAAVVPVSDRSIDGGPAYVFLKTDIDKLDLHQMLVERKKRRQYKPSKSKLISLTEASKYLKTTEEAILELVANGILKTYTVGQDGNGENAYHFRKGSLKKLKGRITHYVGLIAVSNAARLCGMNVEDFKAKYVRSHRLNPIRMPGDSTRYFRRKEIEELFKGQLLNATEVCSVLKIGRSQLFRLTVKKVLRPISGPHIDGSGLNLFVKNDVEKLHSQRESFKRQREAEGGSGRFGSPAGARSAPVRDTIGPRIDELRVRALARGKQLTAPPLHRQLVAEGFIVGINSVYLYLRRCRALG